MSETALAILVIAFLPAINATSRHHHNWVAIGVLCLICLGATVWSLGLLLPVTAIGWVVAMVWSCTQVRERPSKIVRERPSKIVIERQSAAE